MSPVSTYTFKNWQKEQLSDPEFIAAAHELEPGFQIACLRIERGLTQAQLAELVGTKQPSIARLEGGETTPSLPFLKRVAEALNAHFEIRLVSDQSAENH